jgi:DNA/RNA-binding domain of Phe-tRNA-synthetase-like protein
LGGAEHEVVSFLEATGKREQAVSEFREFLSRFEGSPTRLPQVAEARAPLKRLGAL